MKRSVMKQGPSTLVISLPASWAKRNSIKKGDQLEIIEHNGSLVVEPKKEVVSSSIKLDLAGTLPMTKRIAGAVYKAGYDNITLCYSSSEELEQIKACFNEVVGLDIVEQQKGSIVIKKLAALEGNEFDSVLKKQFQILGAMAEESLLAIVSHDKKLLQEVIVRDNMLGKFSDFCRRQLIQQGWSVSHRTPAVFCIVEQLEKIADGYKAICKEALSTGMYLNKDTQELYKEVNCFVGLLYSLYYSFDLKKVTLFGKEGDELKKKLLAALHTPEKKNIAIIAKLASLVELTFDLNGVIMVAFVQ